MLVNFNLERRSEATRSSIHLRSVQFHSFVPVMTEQTAAVGHKVGKPLLHNWVEEVSAVNHFRGLANVKSSRETS